MRRVITWLACAALLAAPARGEEKENPTTTGIFTLVRNNNYWIGAMCQPTDDVVRQQLNLGDVGLTVFQVLPESPAAKAGLKMHDVITAIGGKPVSNLPQMVEAVTASEGKALKLEVLRSGKKETLTVEPAKRPEADVLQFQGRPLNEEAARKQAEMMREMAERMRERLPEGEARQMQEWVEKFRQGESQPLRVHMFGPGVVMHSAGGNAPLPEGVTVTIKKTGAAPTAITVERGDETWTLTDKELHRLPRELQGPVGAMVGGGGPMTFQVQSGGATAAGTAVGDAGGAVQVQIQTSEGNHPKAFTVPLPRPGANPALPAQVLMPQSPSRAELENLKEQVEQLQKQVDELQKNKTAPPVEAKKKTKSKETM